MVETIVMKSHLHKEWQSNKDMFMGRHVTEIVDVLQRPAAVAYFSHAVRTMLFLSSLLTWLSNINDFACMPDELQEWPGPTLLYFVVPVLLYAMFAHLASDENAANNG